MGSPVTGVILSGGEVTLLDDQDGWYRVVRPAEGEPRLEGWVWGGYLTLR